MAFNLKCFSPVAGKRYAIGPGTKKRPVANWHYDVEIDEWTFQVENGPWTRLDECPQDWTIAEIDSEGCEIAPESELIPMEVLDSYSGL